MNDYSNINVLFIFERNSLVNSIVIHNDAYNNIKINHKNFQKTVNLIIRNKI